MNDIFLSYASPDREMAKKFAEAMESRGWSVWWDREIPVGQNFDRVIEEELKAARCAVVLWSRESVRSRWVRTEASAAASRGCLIPVLIERAPIPLEFTLIQVAELLNWNGDPAHPEFLRVVEAIEQIIAKPVRGPVEVQKPPQPVRRRLPIVPIAVIVVLIIAVMLGRSVLERQSTGAVQSNEAGSTSTSSTTGPTSPNANAKSAPTEGTFTIKIGDRIGDGAPAAGAGVIDAPYGQDVYTFSAAPGQTVYFRMLSHGPGMQQIQWRLADPGGAELFNTCLGCGEVGVQTLTKGGTYSLSVGGNEAATGAYQLQLFNVPPPDRFNIKIGQRIAQDSPAPGAATIEGPGSEDVYTFMAAPRQRVYFRHFQHSNGMDQIKWQLLDENMMEIFNTCLGCGEAGVQTLIRGGTYTLTVGNKRDPATGTYAVQLFNVPAPDRFSIKIGDRIRDGVPRAGAGVIETPGAEDIYLFTATPAQKVYFRMLQHATGMDQIRWRLVDENDMELFNTCMGCGEVGLQTLTKGGVYNLIVGSATNPSTGNYALEIGPR